MSRLASLSLVSSSPAVTPPRVAVVEPTAETRGLLTPNALAFVGQLARRFTDGVDAALHRRVERRARLVAGSERLDFLPETADIRRKDWRVAPVPRDLQQRVVEITGPTERKMMINALNSGADVFVADLEDSLAPTWANLLAGQANLRDAVRRSITWNDPATGKAYKLNTKTATLIVRTRGLHLVERHVTVNGRAIPGALFDAGLFLYHNARALIERGSAPYLYLPKLESRLEARLWNDILSYAERHLAILPGTIKTTVLIETLPAAFEMDEILYELRERAAGLNCGRWDYIFSTIKYRAHDDSAVLPDRSRVTMDQPCMRAYTQLAVKTCHRRGTHAIGGMAAQIPIKNDPDANDRALAKVRADKLREVGDGHDGTWVAHPALVAVAREIFAANMSGPNQLDRLREDVNVGAKDLLRVPTGERTEQGLRLNVRVGVQYIEAWLRGVGCVPLYNLMEDAATAEISRAQVWQWIRHGARLDDTGATVTADLLTCVLEEEMRRITMEIGATRVRGGRFTEACELFFTLATADTLTDFLTSAAYAGLDDAAVITLNQMETGINGSSVDRS